MHVHATIFPSLSGPSLGPVWHLLQPSQIPALGSRHAINHGWGRQKLVGFSNESSRLIYAVCNLFYPRYDARPGASGLPPRRRTEHRQHHTQIRYTVWPPHNFVSHHTYQITINAVACHGTAWHHTTAQHVPSSSPPSLIAYAASLLLHCGPALLILSSGHALNRTI